MANNSKRERILEYLKAQIAANGNFALVQRAHPTFKTLKTWVITSLPFCGILGGLPVPNEPAIVQAGCIAPIVITSSLQIDLLVFFTDPTDPDMAISFLADELWQTIYKDVSFGGLVESVEVVPDPLTLTDPPHIAFLFTVTVVYDHDWSGI